MASRSRDVPEEELFMSRPAPEDCDSPTVEPLRIFKPQSPAGDKASNRPKYPAPPSSSATSKPAIASLPPLPSFPFAASSSAAPLPYPDDSGRKVSQSAKPSRLPYPDDDRKSSSSPGSRVYSPPPTSSSPAGRVYSPPPASSSPAGRVYSPPPASLSPPGQSDFSARPSVNTADRKAGLAERRGAAPKPLSPTSPAEDKDDLFAKPLRNPAAPAPKISNAYQQKPYYPPPGGAGNQGSNINRFSSTASTSTTRASRGSPPPPETPIAEPGAIPGGGIEARYAAAGISGTATLNSLQAPSAAAQSRLAHYGGQPPAQVHQPRPWTPTETPDQQPYGPPTVYQGADVVSNPTPPQQTPFTLPQNPNASTQVPAGANLQVSVLEQDFQRMQASTPPPAYTSVNPNAGSQYPSEKQRPAQANSSATNAPAAANAVPAAAAASAAVTPSIRPNTSPAGPAGPAAASSPPQQKPKPAAAVAVAAATTTAAAIPAHNAGHPAFANEAKPAAAQNGQPLTHTPSLLAAAQSPPPLPEGWIAHLDQNSGQYYYIHLATQATQWEFPKGPTPLNHEPAPLSPTASTYGNPLGSPLLGGGKAGLASPMFHPQGHPGYAESIMSVTASVTPSTAGFTGPPPSAGVDVYKVMPTNGVYFGPYLRYVNMDLEKGIWLGSIMIVTDAPQPPTIHIHLSVDLSPNPRQLIPHNIYTHQRWTFYKYDVDLQMSDHGTERWTYAVTSHLGCTRYEFVVAGRYETGWRMIAHSGNDFAPSTNQNERAKLGGVGFMWKDILQKNVECGGFHVQLGLGAQIYGDRLWREVPLLKQWLAMQGRENRKNAPWTARHQEDVSHAYFHYYTSHFDQPFMREAFAQIPHVLQIDDHDIFDGFGSYPDYMQSSAVFKGIGRIAIEMYLLFQHHTTVEILRNVSSDMDLFTITGAGWHFVKFLGPAVVVIGPDCRSERTQNRVMAGPTYQGIFPKVATLPPSVQHCIWMISVPVVYPRLETVETLANTFATGKKAVNTTYNILGKVTSSVAGVVGGKEVVQQGFTQVKKAVGKSGLMGNVLNQFGDFDIGEELKDLWTHDSKDLERTYLIRTLQGIAQQKGIRMTFLSGDVNCSGAGLVHDPTHPSDHKTMYQIIASPVVAAPCSNYLLKMLHNNKLLYVPQNGHKSTHEVSDTKEDMMEIFHTDASGGAREHKKLMARRNYVAIVAYDPEAIAAAAAGQQPPGQLPGQPQQPGYAASVGSGNSGGLSKLSLAVDFVVQGDGAFTATTKYGPVIIPHLEFGH
ncbi:WW domain-containing protein [Madurella fahalii]|uniref:WW domain-containing protein n=1 Tax=Madurella fahalii TaxID=1157608 RepID=A0ABQ0FY66_9PEZI